MMAKLPCGHDERFHLMGAQNGCCACQAELLAKEVEALQTATYYWDDRDLESVVDPSEVVAFDDVGDIVELRPIHELPRRWALVTEDGVEWFDSREAAEAAKEKP